MTLFNTPYFFCYQFQVLEKIFERLDSEKDRAALLNSRQVNRHWNSNINALLEKRCLTGLKMWKPFYTDADELDELVSLFIPRLDLIRDENDHLLGWGCKEGTPQVYPLCTSIDSLGQGEHDGGTPVC